MLMNNIGYLEFEIMLFAKLLIIVTLLQWITFLDSEGRVMDAEALRKRIFYGGLDHNLRSQVCIS